jgi:tRNA-intron endonuclease
MEITGELVQNHIIVRKPSDVGRLYNKSHFGTPLAGNLLQLDILEGVFLLDEGKMRLFQQTKRIDFQHLIMIAVQQIPDFETKYLVFKDLRNRGHAITLLPIGPQVTFQRFKQKNDNNPPCVIVAYSERDVLDIDATTQVISKLKKKNGVLWFALVDEEGDLTYYEVSTIELKGDISEQTYQKSTSYLLKNRLIVFDKKLSNQLLQKEFFGKPFGEVLQLSFVEGLYLLDKGILQIQTSNDRGLSMTKVMQHMQKLQPDIKERLVVFQDLKQRGLIVKTGFKFGAHFRVYTKQPDATHAEYLVHVVEKGFRSIWAEISRAVRLAHSVNKEFVFARIDGKNIEYIKLGRLRP